MSRVFIVDTENTNDFSFLNYYKVSFNDSIYLLFNDKSQNLDYKSIRDLFNIGCNVEFIELKCTGIPNGLDFQISAFLGSLVNAFNKMISGYYVVSNDRGFLANKGLLKVLYPDVIFEVISPSYLSDSLKYKPVIEDDSECLSDKDLNFIPNTAPNLGTNLKVAIRDKMSSILSSVLINNFSNVEVNRCVDAFFSTNSLLDLRNRLVLYFGIEIGGNMYNHLEPFYGKSINQMIGIVDKTKSINSDKLNYGIPLNPIYG